VNGLPKVEYYGTIGIGDLSFEAVVLEDGTRGYIQKQLMPAIGIKFGRGSQGRGFLERFAPNYLLEWKKTDVVKAVRMPHGGKANIFRVGILTEIVSNVVDAALDGKLHHQHRHVLGPCRAIYKALAHTGETALIDEATGYQHHREPDALQELFARLIRSSCATWERRFAPDYYDALFRLFGWCYRGDRRKPSIIGQITLQWVYEVAFPTEIVREIKERRASAKLHQWLTEEGGLPLLEKQRGAVTMIARSSVDFPDFNDRCGVAFNRPGQAGFVFPLPLGRSG
jgi:hypothetical protein